MRPNKTQEDLGHIPKHKIFPKELSLEKLKKQKKQI